MLCYSFLTSLAWISLQAFILYVLLLSQARFYFFMAGRLTLLPCHLVIPTMLLFDLCQLGLFLGLLYAFLLLNSSSPVLSLGLYSCFFGLPWPISSLLSSLAHFILLGIPDLFHFLGHPWPIPILHSHGLLLSILSFPSPSYHIIYFRGLQAFPPTPIYLIPSFGFLQPILACFPFLIMPMGLLLLFSGFFGSVFFI